MRLQQNMPGSLCLTGYDCRRFDLLHVMIDEPDDVLDYRIAQHIVAVHQCQVRHLSSHTSGVVGPCVMQ